MSKTAPSVVDQADFYRRLKKLKRRQNRSFWIMLSTVLLLLMSIAAVFFQQDMVYAFFDLSPHLIQLHLPLSVEVSLSNFTAAEDFFSRLMTWTGWLLLKIVLGIVSASVFMRLIRTQLVGIKRFKRYLTKLMLWCLAFVMVFSGLSLWQQQRAQSQAQPYQQLMAYDQQILDSPLAQYLSKSQQTDAMQAYLLAQTALLHQPRDRNAAQYYADRLVRAEKSGVDFNAMGIDGQTLWSIQHQVYGKSLTPMAEQIESQVQQAQRVSIVVARSLYLLMAIFTLLILISYALSRTLNQRHERITLVLNDAGINVNEPPRIEAASSGMFSQHKINQHIDLSKKVFRFIQTKFKGPKH